MERVCKNCKFANKRGPFSFKKNGAYAYGFECLKADEDAFKKDDDTCNDFKEKENNDGNNREV